MKKVHLIYIASVVVCCLDSCNRGLGQDSLGDTPPISFKIVQESTRGTEITTNVLKDSTFSVDAFLEKENRRVEDDSNPHYMSGKVFSFDKVTSTWKSADAMWKDKVFTNFWCCHPISVRNNITFPTSSSSMTDDSQKSISLSYTMPASSGTGNDATLLKDVLFAYAHQKYDSSSSSSASVTITFHHILSAVSFGVGNIQTGFTLKSIGLVAINNQATCEFAGSSTSSLSLNWKNRSGSATYIQDVTSATIGETSTGNKIFWVIPQTPSDATAIRAVFNNGTTDISVDILTGTATTWQENAKYTYTISFDGINAVASLTESEVNWYNEQEGEWGEYGSKDDYTESGGSFVSKPSAKVNEWGKVSGSW